MSIIIDGQPVTNFKVIQGPPPGIFKWGGGAGGSKQPGGPPQLKDALTGGTLVGPMKIIPPVVVPGLPSELSKALAAGFSTVEHYKQWLRDEEKAKKMKEKGGGESFKEKQKKTYPKGTGPPSTGPVAPGPWPPDYDRPREDERDYSQYAEVPEPGSDEYFGYEPTVEFFIDDIDSIGPAFFDLPDVLPTTGSVGPAEIILPNGDTAAVVVTAPGELPAPWPRIQPPPVKPIGRPTDIPLPEHFPKPRVRTLPRTNPRLKPPEKPKTRRKPIPRGDPVLPPIPAPVPRGPVKDPPKKPPIPPIKEKEITKKIEPVTELARKVARWPPPPIPRLKEQPVERPRLRKIEPPEVEQPPEVQRAELAQGRMGGRRGTMNLRNINYMCWWYEQIRELYL